MGKEEESIIKIENLSLNSKSDGVARSTRHILLSSNVKSVSELLSSSPAGVLITGGDRQTRRAIVEQAAPKAYIFCATAYVTGCAPPSEDFLKHDVLCVDDVDFPSSGAIEANVKSLFPVFKSDRTVIGLAASYAKVPAALRRANRFQVVHRVVSPSLSERQDAWQRILHSISVTDNAFSYPCEAAVELAAISPAYGFHDFNQIVQRLILQMPSSRQDPRISYDVVKATVSSHTPMLSSIDLPFVTTGASSMQPSDVPEDWGEHAGYTEAKQVLTRLAEWPVLYADTFTRLGIRPPQGVLLHGPHGCGKTLLANSFLRRLRHANWLSVSASDLFCKYLGESEARVRALFERGRALSPCVVMIDEIDILGRGRDDDHEGSSGVERRVLAALLTELDGVQQSDVFVLACTSKASLLDPALVRPGRLDQIVEVNLPHLQDRVDIFTQLLNSVPVVGGDEDKKSVIDRLANSTEEFTGAMLDAICREAAMFALEEEEDPENIHLEYFERAAEELKIKVAKEIDEIVS